MIRPDRETFLRLAGSNAVVPVTEEAAGDLWTPVSLFQRFGCRPGSFLLESVEDGSRWSRYSIMGRAPLFSLEVADGTVRGAGALFADPDPDLQRVPEQLAAQLEAGASGPFDYVNKFHCGLVGYFAYDFIRYVERIPDDNPDPAGMPDARLSAPGEVLVYDHLRGRLQIIVNVRADQGRQGYDDAVRRIAEIRSELAAPPDIAVPVVAVPREEDFSSDTSEAAYCRMVERAREYIRDGDIFQVVLSRRYTAPFAGDPFLLYRALRSVNPSPYLFYFQYDDAALVGASPEMLVQVTDRAVSARPIAGTRRRGADAEEDAALADELLADEKERAEHFMLVDLARNDIGRVSAYGSVSVKGLCRVERFSHVMHLVSDVDGQLADGKTAMDALGALLPAGTLSGAPKVRAMEIIDELEGVRRGFYGGAVGYLGLDGQADTCIAIRSALVRSGQIHIQAGAGIVADSVPKTEYEETRSKARALFAALRYLEEGL